MLKEVRNKHPQKMEMSIAMIPNKNDDIMSFMRHHMKVNDDSEPRNRRVMSLCSNTNSETQASCIKTELFENPDEETLKASLQEFASECPLISNSL